MVICSTLQWKPVVLPGSRFAYRPIRSSAWREEVIQADTIKTICSTMLGTKFQKFNGLIYGRFFLLLTVLFKALLKAFHFFEFFT